MRAESRSKQRGAVMAGNNRKRHYGILLLLALGGALLSVALVHKLRERRVAGLFHEQEQQLLALQLLLQKEREDSREVRNKLDDLKAKTISLINQKSELNSKLMEAETDVTNLRRMQREMEAALEEKQNQINRMEEKAAESITTSLRATALDEQLKQKEAEIEEMKQHLHLKESAPAEDNSSGIDTSLSSNKEEENAQGGAEEKGTNNPSDEKSSTEVSNANVTANEQEQPSKEGTWVQLKTEVEDEDSKSENKGENNGDESKASEGNRLEKIEISEEGESAGKQEETRRESSNLQVTEEREESTGHEEAVDETNGNGIARKEQEVAKEGEPERPEQKEGTEDTEKNDQNKPKHRRGKKKKNKTKSRRQDAELRGAAAAGDEQKTSLNAEDGTRADSLAAAGDGSGNSPSTDEKQHGEGVVETSIDGREGTQVEDGKEGSRKDIDEQQEQETNAASAEEKAGNFQETQTDGSVLRENSAAEADDGAIKETATMSNTTTSSERR